MYARLPGISIEAVSATVPRDRVRISEMTQFADPAVAKRAPFQTGIEEIRRTSYGQTGADLCFRSAGELLRKLPAPQVGAIVFVTTTPDYTSPSSSAILQDKLGLSRETVCLDLNYGCSGFVYGLFEAAVLLAAVAEMDRILLLTAETVTKAVDPTDTSTALIFGDAGTACLIRRGLTGTTPFLLQTDGSGYRAILREGGGFRNPDGDPYVRMDGGAVLDFVMDTVSPSIENFIAASEISPDRYYFHQAGKQIVEYLGSRLEVSSDLIPTSYKNYGNTGGAAVPLTLALDIASEPEALRKRSLVSAFGVGLSWGHTVLDLSKCVSFGVGEE